MWPIDLRIVQPETRIPCQDGDEGEIWISSDCVAGGYWNKPELTEYTFHAKLAGAGEEDHEFLRTGDLGYMEKGHLYVTGRMKDLIILNGKNYYPEDIEQAVGNASPDVRPGCSAAFSIASGASGDQEAVAVVFELRPGASVTLEQLRSIRNAVARNAGVAPQLLVAIQPRTILKTTSGKIRRRAVRKALQEGQLRELLRLDSTSASAGVEQSSGATEEAAPQPGQARLRVPKRPPGPRPGPPVR